MPACRLYQHGITASIENMGNPNPPIRGNVTGWSPGAARRNTNFLRSVDETALSGEGCALTLTVAKCPDSPDTWRRLTESWIKRQTRSSYQLIRLHWVMEFQRRGVPHLHCAAWYDSKADDPKQVNGQARTKAVIDWLQLAEPICGAGIKAQYAREIDGAVGWFQYMAKHCSRSHKHYQRQRAQIPASWASCPRVWGHRGDWVTHDPLKVEINHRTFHALRRAVRNMRIAECRSADKVDYRQLSYLRRILKCNEPDKSAVRPVSEWMSINQQSQLLEACHRSPRDYTQREQSTGTESCLRSSRVSLTQTGDGSDEIR